MPNPPSYIKIQLPNSSRIIFGQKNVPAEIAKSIFGGDWDDQEKSIYFDILEKCNGVIFVTSGEGNCLRYGNKFFIVSKKEWQKPEFNFFMDCVNRNPVLREKIKISVSTKDEYNDQRKNSASKPSKSNKDTSVSKKSGSKEKKSSSDNEKLREEIKDARAKMFFCDEAIASTSDIVNVLAGENGFFPSEEMRKILTERYEKMRENYLKTDWTDSDWTQKDPCSNSEGLKIVPQNNDYDAALLQVPGEYCYQSGTGDWKEKLFKTYDNIGHDMPVWLYYPNDSQNRPLSQRPRVMIVSQDPLRSGYPENDVLLLSTPWAHHSLKFLENPDPARLKALKIIHEFLKKGAIVYLTDVHKLYFTRHGNKLEKLKDLQKNESDPNKKIDLERQIYDFEELIQKLKQSRKKFLDEEITLFQPNIIISMGIEAADVLTGSWNKHKDTVYQNRVYVKYHPGAYLSDNPRGNDPTYWLRTENGENDSFII